MFSDFVRSVFFRSRRAAVDSRRSVASPASAADENRNTIRRLHECRRRSEPRIRQRTLVRTGAGTPAAAVPVWASSGGGAAAAVWRLWVSSSRRSLIWKVLVFIISTLIMLEIRETVFGVRKGEKKNCGYVSSADWHVDAFFEEGYFDDSSRLTPTRTLGQSWATVSARHSQTLEGPHN